MPGKLFTAFLIVVVAAILFMLPVIEAVYDFRTSVSTSDYSSSTNLTGTTSNVTLVTSLYEDDLGSVIIFSDDATDTPLPASYNSTTRALWVSGLAANTTRVLEVTFDYDALQGSTAINTLMDRVAWIWLLVAVGFAPAALFSIFARRGR